MDFQNTGRLRPGQERVKGGSIIGKKCGRWEKNWRANVESTDKIVDKPVPVEGEEKEKAGKKAKRKEPQTSA